MPCTVLALASASQLGLPMPIHGGAVTAVRSASARESPTGLTPLFAGLVRSAT
jgi:hypothetical protein